MRSTDSVTSFAHGNGARGLCASHPLRYFGILPESDRRDTVRRLCWLLAERDGGVQNRPLMALLAKSLTAPAWALRRPSHCRD